MNRYDMFPHIEERMSMTAREWLHFHMTMHRQYSTYAGRKMLKTPFDWIVLGDLIADTRPELIIELGSFEGASTLWMAHYCDSNGINSRIISVDIAPVPNRPEHPRITWITGDGRLASTVAAVRSAAGDRTGMVIEDSDHRLDSVRTILPLYDEFVRKDCYFLVEDTIVDFLQLPPFSGPLKAVQEYVARNADRYVIDRSREKYIFTHNPMGYLLKLV